jgi:hypothetical protein
MSKLKTAGAGVARNMLGAISAIALLSASAPPALAQSGAGYVRRSLDLASALDQVIARDAEGWWFNRYDRGSVRNARVTYVSPDGRGYTARAEYSFNGASTGWVEVAVRDDALQCLQYWDISDCRPINNAGSPWGPVVAVAVVALAAAAMSGGGSGNSRPGQSAGSRPVYYPPQRSEPNLAYTPPPREPIGGSNGLYGCASPPCW